MFQFLYSLQFRSISMSELGGVISGCKVGEDETTAADFVSPVYNSDGLSSAIGGTYAINGSGGSARNYVFDYDAGALTLLSFAQGSVVTDEMLQAIGIEDHTAVELNILNNFVDDAALAPK